MMATADLLELVQEVIASIKPDSDRDYMAELRFFFPDTLLLSALDLIDRESVLKYVTPWGSSRYEVIGSTAMYSVFPGLRTSKSRLQVYCTCPAYSYSVLISESHLMCKHVLAILLAERLSNCIERPVSQDDLASIVVRQCS
ncbi:hypothetical protein BKA93DRAFT_814134 [Sparassis latifolia]